MNFVLCNALYDYIYSYLSFIEKIRFKNVCKKFNDLRIIDLYNIKRTYTVKLNENILRQRTYAHVTELNLCLNHSDSFNLNFLTSLKNLNVEYNCKFGDESIKDLNLKILSANNNSKITKIKHMNLLKNLDISRDCGVDDNEIANLNL